MKVLVVTPYITIDGHTRFEKNKTGFGHMVWLICKAMVSLGVSVSVFSKSGFGQRVSIEGVGILSNSPSELIGALFGPINPYDFFRIFEKNPLKNIYDFLSTRRAIKISMGKFDVVHLHGVNDISRAVISSQRSSNVGVVLTLHGFRNPGIRAEDPEFKAIRECLEMGGVVTTISSGIKNKIISLLSNQELSRNLFVICNGVFSDREKKERILSKNLDSFYHILLVGNITANKNQIQVVRALTLLDEALKKRIRLHIVGNECDGGLLRSFVVQNNLSDLVVMHGYLKRDDIVELYKIASGIFSVSYMEGFGMPLCEAMSFGVPIAMFSDLDAAADIYDIDCGVLIKSRDDESVAKAIEVLINSEWDEEKIRSKAANFTFEEMAKRYTAAYEIALQ